MVLLVAVVLVAVVLVTVGQSVGVRVVEQRVVAVTPGEALHQKKNNEQLGLVSPERTWRFRREKKPPNTAQFKRGIKVTMELVSSKVNSGFDSV